MFDSFKTNSGAHASPTVFSDNGGDNPDDPPIYIYIYIYIFVYLCIDVDG